jgi:hypothetical protein
MQQVKMSIINLADFVRPRDDIVLYLIRVQ